MDFVREVLKLFSCTAKTSKLIRNEWSENNSSFMIFKNSDHFSNQKILLVLISRIVSNYMKLNLPKNLILPKQLLILILSVASRLIPWESLLSYFYFSSDLVIYFIVLSITLFNCGFLMLSGLDKLTQWPLILLSKNKLISNLRIRIDYVPSKWDALTS